jgi:hypothetical protein
VNQSVDLSQRDGAKLDVVIELKPNENGPMTPKISKMRKKDSNLIEPFHLAHS